MANALNENPAQTRSPSYKKAFAFNADSDAELAMADTGPTKIVLSSYGNFDTVIDEDAAVDAQEEKEELTVPLSQLWRYRTSTDLIKLGVGALAAYAEGWGLPLLLVVFGEALNELARPDPMEGIERLSLFFVYIGIATGVLAFIQRTIFIDFALRMTSQLRRKYVDALIRQDMAWHDENPAAALEIRLVDAAPKIKVALGAKLGNVFMQAGTVSGGLIFAFYYSAELAGISFAGLIPVFFAIAGQVSVIEGLEVTRTKMYEAAGVVAHEVLALVRVVATFGTYERESKRYSDGVSISAKKGKKWAYKAGFLMALPDAMFQLLYALMFWHGGSMIRDAEIEVGDILLVFFNVLVGVFTAAIGLQYLKDAQAAKVAGHGLFDVIDRSSKIDGLSEEGMKPDKIVGNVEVKNVHFAYPSAPDRTVLNELSFDLKKGKTTALIGHSGCGKSTIYNLLLRFYNPTSGSILIDGKPIADYNVDWLRNRIGLVAQQPTLLPGSIFKNIAMGKTGATVAEVEAAAKAANAHNFINSFPDKYNTEVGSLGGKLSGGQKQRIAIARTMIANPDILLLDEATSALDSVSEATFQQLLYNTRESRATVVIAHRLSTVQDADEIIVMEGGTVIERGNHEELLAMGGKYHEMITAAGPVRESKASVGVGDSSDPAVNDALQSAKELEPQVFSIEKVSDLDLEKKQKKAEEKAMWSWVWTFTRPEMPIILFSCLGGIITGCSNAASFIVLGLTLEVVAGGYNEKWYQCEVDAGNTIAEFGGESAQFDCLGSSLCTNVQNCWGCTYNNGTYVAITGCTPATCTEPDGCSFEQHFAAEESELNPLILAMVVTFGTLLLGKYIQVASELHSTASLTARMRAACFNTFIHKSAAWHDKYSTSEMTESLAVSCGDAAKLSSMRWPKLVSVSTTIIASVVAAFIYCWRLALVVCAVLPLLIASQASDMATQLGLDGDNEDQTNKKSKSQEAAGVAAVIIENHRDIVALGRSRDMLDAYTSSLDGADVEVGKKTIASGFTAFSAQIVMFCQWGLAFWYGGKQMVDGHCDYSEMNIAFIAILFSGFQAGQEMAFVPDAKAATETLVRAHKMITSQTRDDEKFETDNGAIKVASGTIEFKDVVFSYPTRKEATVLNGLNLKIEAGKKVALVGPSGCGKSTTISLIQKLYSVDSGSILIDGQDINSTSPDDLRKQLAVVPQEPKLFNISVADNIAYRPQDSPVLKEKIVESAKVANADSFIKSLDGGYDFVVGKFGDKLSGGQNQRVAIARSIFSDEEVKILLLDEATSALDNKNEVEVQAALDKAAVNRTTVIIAHRLNTIKDADCIYVLKDGQLAEQGTFSELMALDGEFADLYRDSAPG